MMKTFKYFSFVWLLLATTTLFVACGDDDDPQDQPVTPIDNNSTGGNSPDSDTGNTNMEDAVVTGGVADLSSFSVTIYGYVNNDDPQALLGMGIVYGTESDATKLVATGTKVTATSFDPGTNNRRFSVRITDLIPNTTYYYYAFAGQKTANDILSFTTPDICPDKNHPHMIDLGLPSCTKWACCNVGASVPEKYGDYFAWGETEGYNSGKTTFDWSTYKWCNGSSTTMTKYCTNSSYGTVDNKKELDLADDAAYVNWGPEWRMPTRTQFEELINSNYTTTTWTTRNGVSGRLITSKSNGNSIFLPAAGCRDVSSLDYVGSGGYYWSRTLYESYPDGAWCLHFGSGGIYAGGGDFRYYGRSVRPVRASE